MFKKWFDSYGSITLFGLCFIFIYPFRSIVILYLLAKFLVLLVEALVLFVTDLFKTLTSCN